MLRNNFRQLVRNTFAYSLNSLLGPLFSLLLTPLYARMLGVENYGIIGVITPLGMLLFQIASLSIPNILPVLFYDPQQKHQKNLLSSAVNLGFLWSIVLGVLLFLNTAAIAQLVIGAQYQASMIPMIQLMCFGLPFGVIYAIQSTILRLHFAVWRANALALIYLLCTAGCNIVFVLVLDWQAYGVMAANTATNIVMGVSSLLLSMHLFWVKPQLAQMLLLAKRGLPVLPASLAVWMLSYSDRFFLTRSVSYQQLGLYDIANKLASMLALLIEPFKSAWGPQALAIQQEANAKRTYSKVLTYYCILSFGLALGVSLFAHEALLILTTSDFLAAQRYVWLLTIVPLAGGMSLILGIGLQITQKLVQQAWLFSVAAIANVATNVILIPWLGVLGASLSTTLSYGIMVVLVAWNAQKAYPIPYEWAKIGIIIASYLAHNLLLLLIGSQCSFGSLAMRITLFLLYPVTLWLFGVFEVWELQLFKQTIMQPQKLLKWLKKSS
jgi:O-antigen/teichoic acid export membrane protein